MTSGRPSPVRPSQLPLPRGTPPHKPLDQQSPRTSASQASAPARSSTARAVRRSGSSPVPNVPGQRDARQRCPLSGGGACCGHARRGGRRFPARSARLLQGHGAWQHAGERHSDGRSAAARSARSDGVGSRGHGSRMGVAERARTRRLLLTHLVPELLKDRQTSRAPPCAGRTTARSIRHVSTAERWTGRAMVVLQVATRRWLCPGSSRGG